MAPGKRQSAAIFASVLLMCGGAHAAGEAVRVPGAIDAQMRADAECYNYEADHMAAARETAALDENHTLYLLPCFSGAYNLIYRVYVVDKRYDNEIRKSLFAGYSDESGWYGKDSLVNAHFDPEKGTLSAFEKARGLGDCGGAPTYKWNGYDWRLSEYRYWGKCDGSRMPEQWPVIYRFEEKRKP